MEAVALMRRLHFDNTIGDKLVFIPIQRTLLPIQEIAQTPNVDFRNSLRKKHFNFPFEASQA